MNTVSKGKILETIVTMLQNALIEEDNFRIDPNHKLKDVDGIEREIDVFIDIDEGKFKMSIECKNEKSKVTLEQLDAYITKYKKLEIDKFILVSTSGFQSGAKKRAINENIELFLIDTQKDSQGFIKQKFGTHNFILINKNFKLLSIYCKVKSSMRLYKVDKCLYDKDLKKIHLNDLGKETISQNSEILYQFLDTKNGILLNQKKVLYPTFNSEGLFLKKGNKKKAYCEIEKLNLKVEIWFDYKTHEFEESNHYKEILTNKVLSSFISKDLKIKDKIYSLSIVKNEDEEEKQLFTMQKGNSNSVQRLKEHMRLPLNAIKTNKFKAKIENIRIVPIEYSLAETDVNAVKSNSTSNCFCKQNSKIFKGGLVFVNTKLKKFYFALPVIKEKKMYISEKFPDAISLYFAYAITQYSESERLKEVFPKQIESSAGNINVIIDDTYHKYFQNKIGAIVMLKMAIESFLNQYLPNEDTNGKTRSELEKELSINEKLKVISSINNSINIQGRDEKAIRAFKQINELSQKLQSIPNFTEENNRIKYLDVFEELENIDLLNLIKTSKNFINKLRPDYLR